MYLPVIKIVDIKSMDNFVKHWQKFYSYSNSEVYRKHIKKMKYSKQDLEALFTWKNGMTLSGSGGKERSLKTKILKRIDKINSFRRMKKFNLDDFDKEFHDVSTVWRIFLLHLIRPKEYPMYDQHVHRAYLFIHCEPWDFIDNKISNKEKMVFYKEHYLPFVKKIGPRNLKDFDEALFAFGQYLKIGLQGRNL